jgi:hypothetical protein
MFEDFIRAIPEPRGCGDREAGGVYAESGFSRSGGKPLEHFLFDPPLPLPDGIDLVNKPQLWQRIDPLSGETVLDPVTDVPVYDLLIWIGAEHYPEAVDYIEETRRLGASRRLNPNMDFSKLTRRSRMLLAHPRAIIASWKDLLAPQSCKKRLPYHDQVFSEHLYRDELELGEGLDATQDDERVGPCIFKLWEVLPKDEAIETFEREGHLPLCLRQIGSTIYEYTPTGEQVSRWQAGFILGLPITGIALLQYQDGSVNPRAKGKLLHAIEHNGEMALPFYETDR